MSTQALLPTSLFSSYPFPLPKIEHFTLDPKQPALPVVASDGHQNFFVVWHSNHAENGTNADTVGDIIAWRIPLPHTEESIIVAQQYGHDGTPMGELFHVTAFADLRQRCTKANLARIFYCSNIS